MRQSLSRKNLWAALPHGIRESAGRVIGVLPPKWLLGFRFRRTLQFLERAQWWPAERARQYQLMMLRRLCALAAESPYYGRTFAAAGFDWRDLDSVERLRELPTIDRDTVRAHLEEMRLSTALSARVDAVSTGGTGGVPLQFYIGADRSAIEYAYLCCGWRRAGFQPGTPLAVFRGRVVPPDATGLRHHYDGVLRHHYYSVFHLTEADIARYLEHVRGIGPCFLHAYPSSAGPLARFLRATGTPAPENIRGLLMESEILYPAQRQLIEETFGRACLSSYGQTEKVVAAVGCEWSSDYHVWPTYGFLELLDPQGRPVTTPGAVGEIVGTSFINTVVPFIRYRTGDFAAYVGDTCRQCGREHQVIRAIRGHRIQESLIASDGSRISWTAVNVHDDTFVRVRQFQFIQYTPGFAVLNVVPGTAYTSADGDRIAARLRKKLDGRVQVAVVPVESIGLSPLGKAIFVDQRIPGAASEPGCADNSADGAPKPFDSPVLVEG